MTEEQITTIGGCYVCKRTFSFLPTSVMKITIDPETGLLPGMTVLGSMRDPTPEALARAVEKTICPDCVNRAEKFKEMMSPPALRFGTWTRGDPDGG
jgi:hypothetical protein